MSRVGLEQQCQPENFKSVGLLALLCSTLHRIYYLYNILCVRVGFSSKRTDQGTIEAHNKGYFPARRFPKKCFHA